ncbi:MAG: IS607 family transposase [Candidatus Desulfofervidaceae bacterium]|nr:IS607 family transposase [Candidatus Desulfofervidaceae bacterium]MDL1971409.1 IS607 family transposase [Candidatus Desulfofervidaceae bacterium]
MLLTPKQVEKQYGISCKTLLQWELQELLPVYWTPRGRKRYRQEDIERLLVQKSPSGEFKKPPAVAIYARIAKKKYLKALERQVEFLRRYCEKKGYKVVLEVKEIASGINEKRKGLQRLINMAKRGEIDKVVVESEERLARFGVTYLTHFFESHGVKIEVMGGSSSDLTEELADDLVAIVAALTQKIHPSKK